MSRLPALSPQLQAQANSIIALLRAKNPNDPLLARIDAPTVLAPPVLPPPVIPTSIVPQVTLSNNPNPPSVLTPVPTGAATIGNVVGLSPPKVGLGSLAPGQFAAIAEQVRQGTLPESEYYRLQARLTPQAYSRLITQRNGPGPTGGGILSSLREYKDIVPVSLPLGAGSRNSLSGSGFYSTLAGPPVQTTNPLISTPSIVTNTLLPTFFANTSKQDVDGPSRTLTPTIPIAKGPLTADAPTFSTAVITPIGQGPALMESSMKVGSTNTFRAIKVGAGIALAEGLGFKSNHALGLGGLAALYTYGVDYVGSSYLPATVDSKASRSALVGLLGVIGNKYYNTGRNPLYSFLEFAGVDYAVRMR